MDVLNVRFAELLKLREQRRLPPVQQWNPPLSGEMDILIDRHGCWFHDGRLIERQPLIDLFSTILRKDGDEYFLITPVEKWRIQVEDAPFVAIEMEVDERGNSYCFVTNVGDYVIVGSTHPLFFRHQRPYILVRDGLLAKLTTAVYYQLAHYIREEDEAFFLDCADGPLPLTLNA